MKTENRSVHISRGQDRFILQEVLPIDPIPIHPPGYFAHCYSKEDIQEENHFAKTSVSRPPKELE